VISVGEWGAQVAAAFVRRVKQQAGTLPVVCALPLDLSPEERGLQETLAAELEHIRRLDAVQEARRLGWNVDIRSGSAVVLVASLGDSDPQATCEVVRQLRDRSGREAVHRLALSAVLLCPNGEQRLLSADDLRSFDEGCSLLSQMNVDGLSVSAAEQADLAAGWLALRTLTPLQIVLEQAPLAGGTDEIHFDSLGVAVWEFPLAALTAYLSRRWQRQVVERLLAPTGGDSGTARAFLERCAPPGVPWAQDVRFRVAGEAWTWPSLHLVHKLREAIDVAVEAERARLDALAAQGQAWLDAGQCEARQALAAEVDALLDGPGLAAAACFLETLQDVSRLRAARLEQEIERGQRQVEKLDQEAEKAAQALVELSARIPPFRLGVWLRLFLRPWRLLQLWLLYRELGRRAGVYLACRQSQWSLWVAAHERQWQAVFHVWLAQAADEEQQVVAPLRICLAGLRERLAPDPAQAQALARQLAASALPDELPEYFYRQVTGGRQASPAGFLALYGPLSRWAREAYSAETLLDLLTEHAREELAFLAEVHLDDLLAHTYGGAELRRLLAAFVDAAAPWWMYDESALQAQDRALLRRSALVGLPDANSSLLADLLPERTACFSTADHRQIVAIQIVQGLPICLC